MSSATALESTPVADAVAALGEALDGLVKAAADGGFDHHDDDQLLCLLQAVERVRNRTSLFDHLVVAELDARGLAARRCAGSTALLLTQLLRISKGEAWRRVRAADAVGPRLGQLGEALAPVRERLAAAQTSGDVSPEQVDIIVRALAPVSRRGFDQADIDAGEQILIGYAHAAGPEDLRRLAHQVVEGVEGDGTEPEEQLAQDRRGVELTRAHDGSCWYLKGRLTNDLGAALKAVLEPLATLRRDTHAADPETPPATAVEANAEADDPVTKSVSITPSTTVGGGIDLRHRAQRLHDALAEVCGSVLDRGEVPGPGGNGTRATLVVTIRVEDLVGRTGHGWTSDGSLVPLEEILRVASAADILPVFLSRTGALLGAGHLGRTRRIASRTQSLALVARDGGCSFPGCERDPQWCERHHIVAWIDGGPTDLDNLTLLCRYHHHNFAARGWTCSLDPDGLPVWTPPRWIDPQARPLMNHRIRLTHRQRTPVAVPPKAPART